MNTLDFEAVDQQIQALDLSKLEKNIHTKGSGMAPKAVSMSDICKIWNKIGGIVKLIGNLPLIPKKWREALQLFIRTMDSIC